MDFVSKSIEIDVVGDSYVYAKTAKPILKKHKTVIESLGIPLVYKKVWLSKDSLSSIQAVALDGKNKKQYFYSSSWIESRNALKFKRMYKFSVLLPKLMECVKEDARSSDSKTRTMAYMIKILELTNIRIGNKKYMDQNESHGLTTLKKEHVTFKGGSCVIEFRGKHNVEQSLNITDVDIIKFLKANMLRPTDWVMTYSKDSSNGAIDYYAVSAQDINNYIHDKIGDMSCKDFRTYGANKTFVDILKSANVNSTNVKKNVSHALECTAYKLGNNKATSKKSYVMDEIIDAYTKDPGFIANKTFAQIVKYFCK